MRVYRLFYERIRGAPRLQSSDECTIYCTGLDVRGDAGGDRDGARWLPLDYSIFPTASLSSLSWQREGDGERVSGVLVGV